MVVVALVTPTQVAVLQRDYCLFEICVRVVDLRSISNYKGTKRRCSESELPRGFCMLIKTSYPSSHRVASLSLSVRTETQRLAPDKQLLRVTNLRFEQAHDAETERPHPGVPKHVYICASPFYPSAALEAPLKVLL